MVSRIDRIDNGMKLENTSSTEADKGSFSGDLITATVPVVGNAIIGIIPCPGRNQVGGPWQRELKIDLAALTAWGAQVLVSLVESHEFSQLGVGNFANAVQRQKFRWYHLPISNLSVPGEPFQNAWDTQGGDILQYLERGERMVVHCAGGLGRSGMIAAKLLAHFSTPPDEAIKLVRAARPGAIETRGQENYVLSGPPLTAQPTAI
jgi:ADP-ribosyl-[dinitrogen reductase] hydrolase